MVSHNIIGMIKNERETIAVIFIAGFLTICISLVLNIDKSYATTSIATIVTEIAGTLIGLSLTSFAILIGLIPSLSKGLMQTHALKGLGRYFQIMILLQVFSLVMGLVIISSGSSTFKLLFPQIQLFFFLASLSLLSLFGNYLRLIYNRALSRVSKEAS